MQVIRRSQRRTEVDRDRWRGSIGSSTGRRRTTAAYADGDLGMTGERLSRAGARKPQAHPVEPNSRVGRPSAPARCTTYTAASEALDF